MNGINKIYRWTMVAVLVIITAFTASAQFKIGPRVGIEVNSMHFNSDLWQSSNRAGFTGGLQAEFMIPGLGFGLDASVMYVRRTMEFAEENEEGNTSHRDYFDIPVNLKYKFGIPLLSKVVKPYVFTGPDFAFLTSGRGINEAWRSRKYDVSWNFGFGLEFISHLQIGAGYGVGISKAAKWTGLTGGTQDINGKNRYWTVTAAWLF